MPLLRLETSVAVPEDKRKALLASLSKAVAETIGKPEQYVMVTASQAVMLMSGKPGDGAFVDLRSIGGLSDEVNRKLSQLVGASTNRSASSEQPRKPLADLIVRALLQAWPPPTTDRPSKCVLDQDRE